MAELVDALGSGPSGGNTVGVRVPSWAPAIRSANTDGLRKPARFIFVVAHSVEKPSQVSWLGSAQARVELLRPQRVIFLERLMDPRIRGQVLHMVIGLERRDRLVPNDGGAHFNDVAGSADLEER